MSRKLDKDFIKAYQEMYDGFIAKRNLSPDEEIEWAEADNKAFKTLYNKLLKEYGRIPLEQRLKEQTMNKELEVLPIAKAIQMTADIPEINEILIGLYEEDAEFVEIGLENDEIIVRVVKEDGGATVSGPTSDASHVDTPEWTEAGRKRRKKTPESLLVMTGGLSPILKAEDAVEEQRYTLSPWYVPDSLDAHGEWADKNEVQQAFWKYMAQDNRAIRLQHNTDIVAGEWVEGCTWPYEMTTTVKHPEGDVEYTFPAGTPFLGVIWEPWAWELIKAGQIRGLSIGGSSERLESDLVIEDGYEPSGTVSFSDKEQL